MAYTPFDKPVGAPLTADDLQLLIDRQVSEGYLVEYKGTFPDTYKIGRSLASFANTNGGWYFVGVDADRTNNTARAIVGYDVADRRDAVASVREIAKSHIDPAPVIHPQVVDIGGNRFVLAVHVPAEQETPFVSRDGRIYRRLNDASDPVSDTDRFALDRLIERGRDAAKQIEMFCQDERAKEPYHAVPQGWVNLFLWPYPLGTIERSDVTSLPGMQRLISRSRVVGITRGQIRSPLLFQFGQVTSRSAVLRQPSERYDPNRGVARPTMELFNDGRAKVHVPLRYLDDLHAGNVDRVFRSLQVRDAIEAERQGEPSPFERGLSFFNLWQLWNDLEGFVEFYLDWLGDDAPNVEQRFALRIENVRTTVPIVDLDIWGAYANEYGLPMANSDSVRIPWEVGKGLTLTATANEPAWRTICETVSLAFGLPREVSGPLLDRVRNPR